MGSLRWQLPLILLVALFNPLFSAQGSTVLFYLGSRAVFLESLLYGLAMGGLFVASVLWFKAGASMLSFDKVMALFGNLAPTLCLMISMCMRLIPRFVRTGKGILAAQSANAAAAGTGGGRAVQGRLRASSVLMGWSMEDSLETADSMRARGWSSGLKRSTYTRYRFVGSDAAVLVELALGAAVCAYVAWAATASFAFYPTLSPLGLWWGYLVYAAWMLLPSVLLLLDRRVLA